MIKLFRYRTCLTPIAGRFFHAFALSMVLIAFRTEAQIPQPGTLLSGQEYIDQCSNEGVPIPPEWGSRDWSYVGTLAPDEVFISQGLEARVYKYESDTPEGSCIALPRVDLDTDQIELLGIICLGIESSNACFWDNQDENKVNFPIPVQKSVPLIDFAGGAALLDGSGGECTTCHVGENSFVIHPKTALGMPMLGNLKLEPEEWYKPLVHPDWHQNPLPAVDILETIESRRECTGCHRKDDSGGRFPVLDPSLGYCMAILPQAAEQTMPPRRPQDPRYKAHVDRLLLECGIQQNPGAAAADAPLFPEDPIAVIGHGAFFDKHGKQLEVNTDFLLKAQKYYMSELNNSASPQSNQGFSELESSVPEQDSEQGALVANSALLDWLSVRTEPNPGINSKLALIKSVLRKQLSDEDSDLDFTPSDELLEFIENEKILKPFHRTKPQNGDTK